MQRFIIRWRVWLTHRVTGDWLDGDAYYRGRFLAGDELIDNPDQRIQQDIDIFTTGTGPETNTPTVGTSQTLVFGAITSIVSVVSFTPILWSLAGPLTVFGVTVPKALFWLALVYVFFTTVVAFWIGRPLIRLSFRNELTNAAFRYALVRLRDAGEAVGFYRGERAERGRFDDEIRRDHHQLPGLRTTGCVVPGLEQIGAPDRQPAADGRAGTPGVRRRDSARRHDAVVECVPLGARLAVVLPCRLRLVRRLSRGHHPPRRAAHGKRKGKGATGADRTAKHRRIGAARRRRGPHTCRGAAGRSARRTPDARRLAGHHRRVGYRQDHAAAQPCPTVAVHLGHGAQPRGRHHVPVPDAVRTVGRPAFGRHRIRPRQAISATRPFRPHWTPSRLATSAAVSTRSRTGPRCSPPASSSGSRSPGCC